MLIAFPPFSENLGKPESLEILIIMVFLVIPEMLIILVFLAGHSECSGVYGKSRKSNISCHSGQF